jgi:hypothetical protein
MAARTAAEVPRFEPRWPAAIAVLAAIALYATLPSKFISAQHASSVFRYLVPAIALALLVRLAVTAPHTATSRSPDEGGRRRSPSPRSSRSPTPPP